MAYKIRTVVLDFWGTVAGPFSKGPAEALCGTFRKRRVELTPKEARQYMGLPKPDHIKKTLTLPDVITKWRAATGRDPNPDIDGKELYAIFNEEHTAYLTNPAYIAPIPGALEALTQFRERGVKIGMTTGFNAKEVVTILNASRAIKLESYFDHIIPCDHMSIRRGRPYGDGIWANMIALGCNHPRECVKIGDTTIDILEGKAAGVHTGIVAKYSSLMAKHTEDIEMLERFKPKEYHYYMREVYNEVAPYNPTYVWETLPQAVEYFFPK